MARLYPPQLEGTLPAFYKDYDDNGVLIGCTINIPFGVNRAVNIKAIDSLALRLRTTSTNTYIVPDKLCTNYDAENNIATFKFEYDANDENTDMTASLINESQYYRAQLAFVQNDEIGYYSTVGIIKCIAKPTVYIASFANNQEAFLKDDINQFDNTFLGVYQQDTSYGDSTEKAYSYKFELFDNYKNLILTSDELIHDITQDTYSDRSSDIWMITQDLPVGEVYKLRYTVTTLNGLIISSVDYRVMRAIPVKPEYKIKLFADANFEEGFIDIHLEGETDRDESNFVYQILDITSPYDETLVYYTKIDDEFVEYEPTEGLDELQAYFEWASLRSNGLIFLKVYSTVIGEKPCTGNFLITRACSKDDFFEWIEITRFTIASSYPSEYHFYDYTVEQGIQYQYALQQYNVHNIYSEKTYQQDKYGHECTTMADFEDIFLSDGIRQLKVRFNPKVTSFKNTIPEQKIETIGNKYPFIFRNGSVCYKEFPISGLISFQTDNAFLFLNDDELKEAGIIDYGYWRGISNIDSQYHMTGHDGTLYKRQTLTIPVYYTDVNGIKRLSGIRHVETNYNTKKTNIIYKKDNVKQIYYNSDDMVYNKNGEVEKKHWIIRKDRNLTSENMLGERYFKLKVLDWLTDGKVKLFRSAAEGNYLVRLLNVSLTPQDPLGRMLHTFNATAYEIDELNYKNLVSFGIVNPAISSNYETQWASIDINEILQNNSNNNDFIEISPEKVLINSISIQDFAPGDQIKIVYDSGPDNIFTIGVTGSLELNNDDRKIVNVYIKPNKNMDTYNDFSRSFLYSTTNLRLTKFDAITDFKTYSRVAEQFIGPIDNLLEPFILRDKVYGERNQDGVVLEPLNEIEAFNNVYNDLRAHQRLTYKINEDTEKFTGLKIDHLSVHKKNIIPIYCYTDDRTNIYNNKFGITPFGIPYVNSTNIKEFFTPRRTAIKYVDNVITIDDNGEYIKADGVNIEDIVTVLNESGVTYSAYDLLEPYFLYIPTSEWFSFKDYPGELPFNIGYYDLYHKTWWDPKTEYDPTFSINDVDSFPEIDDHGNQILDNTIIGDNNISLLEINDITLENLEEVKTLRLGSGVIAEVTAQIHVVDYEIEDVDVATKTWKDAYLTTKKSLDPLIDAAMMHIDEINDADLAYEKLITEIQEIETQINLYNQGTSATKGVMEIASSRLVNQKKKVWYTLEQQIEDILDILKTQKVYQDINATLSVDALSDYIYDNDLVEEQLEDHYFDEKQLQASNLLWLYENPTEEYHVILSDFDKIFKIISEAYLFYKPEYENRQNNAQSIKNKCDIQLRNLAIQQGNIIGGYLIDYDDSNPPPANTLIHAQYYIAKTNKQLDEALDHCIEVKSKYITRLLEIILAQLTEENNLNTQTDTYIKQTAGQLINLLNGYITTRNNQMQSLNANQYNKQHIENQIATLVAQRDLLITIRDGAWDRDRRVDTLINTFTPNTTINTEIARIRDTYINDVTGTINDKLINTGKNLNDILNLTDDLDNNERVAAILNILADAYNKEAANNVQSSLKEYFIPKTDNQNETKNKLLDTIAEIDAAYQVKKKQLEDQKAIYEEEEHKYQEQLNEIQKTIDSIEKTKSQAEKEYNEASEALSIGEATKQYQDSEALIENILSNKIHQDNVELAIKYLEWLEQTQSELLNQVGQIFSNLNTAKEYANMMLQYIDLYEVEAFQFLHQYDALEDDLHQGFNGTDGIDWLYFQPHKFWLSSYKDILFLKDNGLDEEWINRLSNPDEQIRLDAYVALETYLKNLFFDKDTFITIGILGNNQQTYRLVQINQHSQDRFYPEIYELNDMAQENPIVMQNGEFLIPDSTRYTDNDKEFRNVEPIEVEPGVYEYHKDPRAKMYYTYNSTIDKLISAFSKDISLVSDEEFINIARAAYQNQKPIKWLTDVPPVQVEINLPHSLFDTFNYESIAKSIISNPDIFLITPNYHKYFDKVLGLIIHDQVYNKEHGSWLGLKEIYTEFLSILSNYFKSYVEYNNLKATSNTNLSEYNRIVALVDDMTVQLNRYKGIAVECRAVLTSYDAQKIDKNSSEYQQLLILLESAEEEIEYYTTQKQIYDSQLEQFLNNNIDFKEYTIYTDMLPKIYSSINDIQLQYQTEYNIYKQKVDHYLYLILNNKPYGHNINRNVLQNEELININGNNTVMYNFGLAYAIEAYKKNRNSDEPINFTVLLESVNKLNNLLNNDFQFVYLIPKYQLLPEGTSYIGGINYYYLDDNNEYQLYTYKDADTWINDVESQLIYYFKVVEEYNPEKSYFIKEDNKFVPYRYIDNTQWEEDREKIDIYYTYYPSLIDFANMTTYRLINDLDTYDPLTQYYYFATNSQRYEPIPLSSDSWQSALSAKNTYVQVGNGGLKGFLNNLINGSNYLNDIKNNYLGTLNLYFSLLAESLGDTTSLENLKLLLAKDLTKKKELEDILKYKNADFIDTAAIINEIYTNLAYYLISLTNAYINLVERSYEVV